MIDRLEYEIVLCSNIRWWSQTGVHTGCAELRFAYALLRLCHRLAVASELYFELSELANLFTQMIPS